MLLAWVGRDGWDGWGLRHACEVACRPPDIAHGVLLPPHIAHGVLLQGAPHFDVRHTRFFKNSPVRLKA